MSDGATKVLGIFDDLINRVKQARPVRTDNKPLGGGVVYSRLVLGMPVDPSDYLHPWAPFGRPTDGNDGRAKDAADPKAGTDAKAVALAAQAAKDAQSAREAQGFKAAYHTAALATMLLQVTDTETYLEYPVGKNLAVNYESIIASMQPGPMPQMDPAVRKQIDDAQRVLFEVDKDGKVQLDQKTEAYDGYRRAALKYQKARAAFATAQAASLADPALAEAFPITSAPLRQAVDDAFGDLQALDPSKVEQALDILGSVGISMQDHMIATARQLLENYKVSLTGLADKTPYSYVLPTGWCDPDDDDEGWQSLSYTFSDVQQFTSANHDASEQRSDSADHTHTDGGAHGGWCFVHADVSAAATNDKSSYQGTRYQRDTGTFKNSAKGLSITMEYMLCTIYRPWLVADLFYLKNWYNVGNKKNAISNGQVKGQTETADPILPMIPQQFLVVRNVNITATEWGDDGEIMNTMFGSDSGGSDTSSSNVSADVGVSFGFVNFGGSMHHDEAHHDQRAADSQTQRATGHFGTTFANNTLTIKGAQIVAFLSDIVPASAPLDDPGTAAKPAAGAAKDAKAPEPAHA